MQLICTDVLQVQPVGRTAKMTAELGDRVDVGLLCRRRQIADCHVLDQTSAQKADLSHRRLPSVEDWSDNPESLRQECFASKSADNCYRGAVSFNPQLQPNDEWAAQRARYMSLDTIAPLSELTEKGRLGMEGGCNHRGSAPDQALQRHIRVGECLWVDRRFRPDQSQSGAHFSWIVGGGDANNTAVHG
jgi:hypothetical protein